MSFVVVDLQNVISGHLKHLKTKTPSKKKVATSRPSSFQVYMKTTMAPRQINKNLLLMSCYISFLPLPKGWSGAKFTQGTTSDQSVPFDSGTHVLSAFLENPAINAPLKQ